jgi:fusion and transport protein UGO1
MIAQTNHKQHRRYSNPIQALVDIVSSEHHGSLWSLYFSPQLFFPTLIVYTVKPILHHASPLIIDRCFGQAVSESPLKSALAHFAILTVGLIILRPVETIRKRLQIQVMGGARELETCVVVGRQYRGFWDCFYRILTEEGGQRQKRPRRSGKHDKSSQEVEEVSWWNSWGISGLYRGFWADTGLNALQCLAHLSSNLPDELEEW